MKQSKSTAKKWKLNETPASMGWGGGAFVSARLGHRRGTPGFLLLQPPSYRLLALIRQRINPDHEAFPALSEPGLMRLDGKSELGIMLVLG